MPFVVYAIALVIAAGTLALSVNLATAPNNGASTQRIGAAPDVRQIPITRQADVSRGDPHNQLSPVYPAAPGKDLSSPADAKTATNEPALPAQSDKPAQAASASSTESTGAAPKEDDGQDRRDAAVVAPVAASTAAAPNSCAIAACSSAYRSFRPSDCTYQPFGGPRKTCELGADGVQNASAVPPSSASRDRNAISRAPSRVGELDDVERIVRRLPVRDDYDDDRGDRIVVIERPGYGYNRRPYIIYQER